MSGWELIYIDEKSLKCEHLNGIYEQLADLVGLDGVIRIYQAYKGQQLNFPVRLFSRGYVLSEVARQYNGKNINTLATKFGYSERQIRQMLKETIDGNIKISSLKKRRGKNGD
jgi:Mor transcription activator family.